METEREEPYELMALGVRVWSAFLGGVASIYLAGRKNISARLYEEAIFNSDTLWQ